MDSDWGEPIRIALGYRIGDFLVLSGHTSVDPETSKVIGVGDFDAQVEQLFRNLASTLKAGGSSLRNVVKVTIFVTDMANYEKVVAFREKYFTPPYPADTIVEVTSLAKPECMIEIEAIAIADEARP
jgi:reactive intermediate/imine deaminase